jgi:two-component system sensor histidine kinase CpxA
MNWACWPEILTRWPINWRGRRRNRQNYHKIFHTNLDRRSLACAWPSNWPNGKLAIQINVGDLIREVVDNVNYECKSDGIDGVSVEASFDASPIMHGYADALISAIENILRNAVRHSPRNGAVNIRLSQEDATAKIEILDQGEGVDDSDLPRLFEPFYRTKKGPDTGTGLGLAIAERAIRLNGGEVTAENSDKGGLRILIKLPVS